MKKKEEFYNPSEIQMKTEQDINLTSFDDMNSSKFSKAENVIHSTTLSINDVNDSKHNALSVVQKSCHVNKSQQSIAQFDCDVSKIINL